MAIHSISQAPDQSLFRSSKPLLARLLRFVGGDQQVEDEGFSLSEAFGYSSALCLEKKPAGNLTQKPFYSRPRGTNGLCLI
jgi:hypothetical protein